MKELEDKIREVLPYLKDRTKGCIIKSKYYGVAELINYDEEYYNYLFVDNKLQFRSDNENQVEVVGHPIKLNDVLEWLCKSKNYSCNMQNGNFYIFGYVWDLSSVFLADQSEELIKFLNEL